MIEVHANGDPQSCCHAHMAQTSNWHDFAMAIYNLHYHLSSEMTHLGFLTCPLYLVDKFCRVLAVIETLLMLLHCCSVSESESIMTLCFLVLELFWNMGSFAIILLTSSKHSMPLVIVLACFLVVEVGLLSILGIHTTSMLFLLVVPVLVLTIAWSGSCLPFLGCLGSSFS